MEEKNIALLGFVSSAADYLREQIKDDGEEIKTLEEVDLNKIKSELENKLGSSFDGAKNKSDDLINAGREVFDNFISKSPTLIDEFKDIFDVDFKKENDEKDEMIVSHLINILKSPQDNYENDDLINQIAKAASEAPLENRPKVGISNADEDKELDSIFSEILANENIEEEKSDSNPIEEETNIEENSKEESKLDPSEIKQLIKDTISEYFTDKKQETVIKLDEVIDSFDELKNVTENPVNLVKEDIELEEVKYDELNTNNYSLVGGVFKRVDSLLDLEENATIEDVFVDDESLEPELEDDDLKLAASKLEDEVNKEQTSDNFIVVDDVLDSANVSDDTVEINNAYKEAENNYLVNYESSYEESFKKENKNNNVEEEIVLNTFNVEEAIEKEFSEIQNKKIDKEETKKTNDDDYSFVDGVLVNETNLNKENTSSNSENIEEDSHIDYDETLSDDVIENDNDSIPLFDDIPLSKKLSSFTDHYESSDNPYSSLDKDDYDFEIERNDGNDSISSFLKELKENKEQDFSAETKGIVSDMIEESKALYSDEKKETESEENEPIIIENDYIKDYNNRTLEEMYIPNPGLNALESEIEDDSSLDESTLMEAKEENKSNEDAYLNDLFDEFTNNDYTVDEFYDKQKQEGAKKKKVFDSIVALYPYLSNGFIKGVYDLKQSFVNDYKDGEKIVILHRLHFKDIGGLREFVDVMINHGYLVNVDEKQMIVDTFKEHVNSDGKILTDIFEIANQGKLLTGDYEGYRIIEDEL